MTERAYISVSENDLDRLVRGCFRGTLEHFGKSATDVKLQALKDIIEDLTRYQIGYEDLISRAKINDDIPF